MQYINKGPNENAGKEIIEALLSDSWNDEDSCYIGANYDGLCKHLYREPLVRLMLGEQNGLCCYCLKQIAANETTLEHIIPHKISISDFSAYLVVAELSKNVTHKDSFDRKSKVMPTALYPHDIAYHNLIGSCDSNAHCNNYRGDRKISPLIFDAQIGALVKYDFAGKAYSDKYDDDLENLGLSLLNSPLILIRRIWFDLTQKVNSLDQVIDEIIDDVIYDLILRFDGTKAIENFTGDPSYRNEILKYKWFFQYYRDNAAE